MFGRKKPIKQPSPRLNKEHEEIRDEVVKSRKMLLKEIAKINRKFDLARTKRNP